MPGLNRAAPASPSSASSSLRGDGDAGHIITIDVLEGAPARRRWHRPAARKPSGGWRRGECGYIELETATNNEAGVAFWQRHGYRSRGRAPGYYLGRIDAYLMNKRLATKPAIATTPEGRLNDMT